MAGAVRGGQGGREWGSREEGEVALGHDAGEEARSSVNSSVPISGPKHVPIRAQVTGTVSSTSSTATSSTDEEFDPQPSLRSKVTLGKPKGALACGGRLPSRFQTQCGLQLQQFR